MSGWAWPEWVIASVMALSVLTALVMHGKDRVPMQHDFWRALVFVVLEAWVLKCGGFW